MRYTCLLGGAEVLLFRLAEYFIVIVMTYSKRLISPSKKRVTSSLYRKSFNQTLVYLMHFFEKYQKYLVKRKNFIVATTKLLNN